ncbi:lysophospholipid acyltransferase family protein [Chloroflexota bacterium]
MLTTLLFLWSRYRVHGRENIPAKGPLLVVANHLNLADPPIVGLSINRRAVFMAKEELFRQRLASFFVRKLGAFPVYRRGLSREALHQAEHWLGKGMALVMFPEGSRSNNAKLKSAFPGSAMVAARMGVPILPIGIAGTEEFKGFTWWLRRPRITVNIGQPFQPPPLNGRLSKEERLELTDSIMGRMAALLPAEYRGKYADGEGKQDED